MQEPLKLIPKKTPKTNRYVIAILGVLFISGGIFRALEKSFVNLNSTEQIIIAVSLSLILVFTLQYTFFKSQDSERAQEAWIIDDKGIKISAKFISPKGLFDSFKWTLDSAKLKTDNLLLFSWEQIISIQAIKEADYGSYSLFYLLKTTQGEFSIPVEPFDEFDFQIMQYFKLQKKWLD